MKASNRIRVGHALVAAFGFLAITLGNSAAVRAEIIATFVATQTNDYVYTGGTTQSSLTTSPSPLSGSVSYGTAFFTGAGGAGTISLSNVVSSTAATGSGSPFNGTQGGWTGSYTITQGTNVLLVTIQSATLAESGGGASLNGNATISIVSGFAGASPITTPESFSIGLSGITASGLGAFGFSNFDGSDVTTTSATPVPEPSTMAIAGLGALGLIGYGIRRRKSV